MAIEVKTITCPQCGSADVDMSSESQGNCKACGTQFTVQTTIETQNIYNEFYINGEEDDSEADSCNKMEIIPEYSKDEFIRKAWIQLAKEDAPLEVFTENFGAFSENEHQILIDRISADVTYQVSVGHDRQEPYIDYEDYWEDEPYIASETYYDSNLKANRTREVTKYKKVKKQRQVTKYKTVTDWSPLNGRHSVDNSVAVVENLEGQRLDKSLFVESFRGADDSSFVPASEELSKKMYISDSAQSSANAEHRSAIDSSVRYSLPGDHHRNLDWTIDQITDTSASLYKATEYETTICFNGKTYLKHAFPFGPMSIGGDKIKNEISLKAITNKMRDELKNRNSDRKKEIEKNVSKATSGISFLTILVLLASILVSLLIRSTALVIIMFIAAVAAFIFNNITVKSATKNETKCAEEEIAAETDRVNAEINDYSNNYKIKQREALDNKLKSLGYEPVTAEEL